MATLRAFDFKKLLDKAQAITINQGLKEYREFCETNLCKDAEDKKKFEDIFIEMENEYRMYGEMFGKAFMINLLNELESGKSSIEIEEDNEDSEESGE